MQERLDLIRRLERRYGMPADELAARHEEMKSELNRLESMEDRLRRAEADYKEKAQGLPCRGGAADAGAPDPAARFESLMETQLRDLGMQKYALRLRL